MQGPSPSLGHAPSHDKARLEELVMRQSKQLVPVVASATARDKGKAKSTAAGLAKLAAGASAASAGGPLASRGKAGFDSSKRGDDASAGAFISAGYPVLCVVLPAFCQTGCCPSAITPISKLCHELAVVSACGLQCCEYKAYPSQPLFLYVAPAINSAIHSHTSQSTLAQVQGR